MVAVIVQYAQIIALTQVAHDNIEMFPIPFFDQRIIHFISNEFFKPFVS